MQKILDILALCPLFFGIRQEDMGTMLSCLHAKQKSFSKGEIILSEGAPAELIGVAEDGSYALLLLRGGGLYRLDLTTLDVTQQMTNAQLEALGIMGLPQILWPGGEYLTVRDGQLLRIVTAPVAE